MTDQLKVEYAALEAAAEAFRTQIEKLNEAAKKFRSGSTLPSDVFGHKSGDADKNYEQAHTATLTGLTQMAQSLEAVAKGFDTVAARVKANDTQGAHGARTLANGGK